MIIDDFYNDIMEIKKSLNVDKKEIISHLYKLQSFLNNLLGVALCTLYFDYPYNLIPIISLSFYQSYKWTIVGHHVCHGGYDKCDDEKYKRKTFAVGSLYRRFVDWFDWLYPDAWNVEHNKYHHYYLNEEGKDPDFVEKTILKFNKKNFVIKNIIFFSSFLGWRYFYYPINSYNNYYNHKYKDNNVLKNVLTVDYFLLNIYKIPIKFIYEVLFKVYLPYISFMYGLLPYTYYFIFNSETIYYNVFLNIFLADTLTNIITFIIIVPNHAGDDVYSFKTSSPNHKEFILRAIIGSVNFDYGTEICDFLHGYLNYQIEHHMFPDLSPLEYRIMAPKVKEVCKKYEIPYIQENVFKRVYKLYEIIVLNKKNIIYEESELYKRLSNN